MSAYKIIGVVGDVTRDIENYYFCEKCSLFGLNEEEYAAVASVAFVTPQNYRSYSYISGFY